MSYERQVPDGMVLLVTLCKTRLFLLFLVLQFAFLAPPSSHSQSLHLISHSLPCLALPLLLSLSIEILSLATALCAHSLRALDRLSLYCHHSHQTRPPCLTNPISTSTKLYYTPLKQADIDDTSSWLAPYSYRSTYC